MVAAPTGLVVLGLLGLNFEVVSVLIDQLYVHRILISVLLWVWTPHVLALHFLALEAFLVIKISHLGRAGLVQLRPLNLSARVFSFQGTFADHLPWLDWTLVDLLKDGLLHVLVFWEFPEVFAAHVGIVQAPNHGLDDVSYILTVYPLGWLSEVSIFASLASLTVFQRWLFGLVERLCPLRASWQRMLANNVLFALVILLISILSGRLSVRRSLMLTLSGVLRFCRLLLPWLAFRSLLLLCVLCLFTPHWDMGDIRDGWFSIIVIWEGASTKVLRPSGRPELLSSGCGCDSTCMNSQGVLSSHICATSSASSCHGISFRDGLLSVIDKPLIGQV